MTGGAKQSREGWRAPAFSIVVPAHNAASTLGEALDSIVAQTCTSWEAVIVDDGSTDGTAVIADDYAARDARFLVARQPNRGPSLARNAGVALSGCALLSFLDADDAYLPGFLEVQQRFAEEHPGFDVYSCDVDDLMPDGTRAPCGWRPAGDGVVETRLDDLLETNRLTVLSVVRREMFERLGGFRASLRYQEDYDLWVRAAATGSRFLHNPRTLALYRQPPARTTEELRCSMLARRQVLLDLVRTARLVPQTRARALAVISRLNATAARLELERQIDSRRFHGARRLLWTARRTYPVKWKLMLALATVMVSPRLLARLVGTRRRALSPRRVRR